MIEIDEATADLLRERAAERGESVAQYVAALAKLADPSGPPIRPVGQEDHDELDRRWAAIEAGETTIPHETVVRWLDTWGSAEFKPWRDR